MTPRIIPFFLADAGCPHRCVYCNRQVTAGAVPSRITSGLLDAALDGAGGRRGPAQIAFYGGDFTGLDPGEQERLLALAGSAIAAGKADSIRISCRPDTLARSIGLISRHPVRTVEIGAQSMSDEVLRRSRRGHTAADVRNAFRLLKERGFEAGIHIMAGLPGDTAEGFRRTVDETADMHPGMVRIHPTIVLAGTELAEMYLRGEYIPLSLEAAVDCCRHALLRFESENIPVIRIGLQTTPEMERPGAILGGPFHPAFRTLVAGSIFLDMALELLEETDVHGLREAEFTVSPGDVSDFRGIRNRNIEDLRERHGAVRISVRTDPGLKRGSLMLRAEGKLRSISRADCARSSKNATQSAPCGFFNVFI
jgi:histone acetyltransferase (RNA polymerase elongator complex component)